MGELKKLFKKYFHIPSFKNPTELTYEVIRILFSLGIGTLVFSASRILYFTQNPLLEVPYTGGVLVGVISFSIIYYSIPFVIRAVADGIKLLLQQSIRENLQHLIEDVMKSQQKSQKPPKLDPVTTSPILLDTSSIIDSRICKLIEQGFIESEILVPQFVLDEVQIIADSKSKLKRKKGKRGLKVLEELKKMKGKSFKVYPTKKDKDVDKALVNLAKKLNARVATVDHNLNKVAKVKGVKVLNINSLVNALKTSLIPGDTVKIKVIKEGEEKNQGVGYLDDGTMIVVNNGKSHVNKKVKAKVEKVLQTNAGQMVFADFEGEVKR